MARLGSNAPVRPLRTSRRSLTGRIALEGAGTASFESSLERDWLVLLDFDPRVQDVEVQPFTLTHEHAGKLRRYTPDVLARFRAEDGEVLTIVYEVKPRDELVSHWPEYRPRFKAAFRHCNERNWRFKIVTERHIRTARLDNAHFLRRYRTLPDNQLAQQQLLYTMRALGATTPQALLAASYWAQESQMATLPVLWQLVASRQIETQLDLPLTMSSPIWLPKA